MVRKYNNILAMSREKMPGGSILEKYISVNSTTISLVNIQLLYPPVKCRQTDFQFLCGFLFVKIISLKGGKNVLAS